MATNENSQAKKQYRVYGTQIMYQDVQAASAEEAYRVADDEPLFEPCESCFTLQPDVKDVEANELIHVDCDDLYCETCGSEIVESINDSAFHDGECGSCEYQRYTSQPDLMRACSLAIREIEQSDRVIGESDGPRTAEVLNTLRSAIRKAHGKAN